jgi:hypothetical protein
MILLLCDQLVIFSRSIAEKKIFIKIIRMRVKIETIFQFIKFKGEK